MAKSKTSPAPERAGAKGRTRRLLGALLEEGVSELAAQWRGHLLTLLGIVWGAASVVLLVSLGAGFTKFLDVGVEKTGARWVALAPEYTTAESGGRRPGRRISFSVDDLKRVRASVPAAVRAAGEIQQTSVRVETQWRTRATVVAAGSPEIGAIKNHHLQRGRWLDAQDEAKGRRVAVLGATLAPIFFPRGGAVGGTLKIRGQPFEVIGVLEAKGFQLFTNYDWHDRMVWIPLRSGRRLFGTGTNVGILYLDLRRIEDERLMRSQLRAALWPPLHLHDDENEAIRFESVPYYISPFRRVTASLTILLGAIGTITLAMAGVGVANLMIAIVSDRRLEFAMRRACGARRSDLMLQLLVETLVVVLAGGLLGVALGLGIVGLLGAIPLPAEIPAPPLLPGAVLTTFCVLVAIGLAAGVVPARMAARVDPSAALRVT